MDKDFLKDLNKDQKQAVLQTDGPIIILAGAGSGKTKCITARVLYLLANGVSPSEIICLTFTNKAAHEMKERIQKKAYTPPTVATFHSLCAKILRIEGTHIGLSNKFVIYDDQDQIDTIKEAMQRLAISIKDYKPSSVLTTISQAKNQLISETEYRSFARGHFQEVVSLVYLLYQKLLKENEALDFDDLLSKTILLFEKNPDVLQKYQNRFRYILIDEYQDTNHAQYYFTKMLAKKWRNICIVGDFSQSIYGWRGADYQNLSKFKDDFPDAKTFALSQNYRSTQKILDAATSVISKNTMHPILKLWTDNPDGEDIVIYEARNEQNEAEFIIRQLADKKYSDVVVLYRTNAQSRVLEEAFLHYSVPYKLVGGTRFYDRKEVKDILSYLRLLDNPKDMASYKRIEKLGKTRLQKFIEFQHAILGSPAQRDDSRIDSGQARMTTLSFLDEVIKATDYLSLYDERDEEDRQRLENIKELRSVATEFPNLTQFLENVALVEQEHTSTTLTAGMPDGSINKNDNNSVTLMTLHAVKGLEFPVVFMVGMEEGLFPHSRTLMDKYELEEERRLCYVGMTRAKEKLFLTYAHKRLFFGQRSSNTVSRFILELPKQVIARELQYSQEFL